MWLARRSAGVLATVALLLAPTGCGSGSAESTSSLTKARFLKLANAICVKETKEMGRGDAAFWKRHHGPSAEPPEALENELQIKVILPRREEELRRIRALGLPQGGERRVQEILTAWQEGVEKAEEDPRSLRAGGPEFAFYKAYSMGIDYGLEKCWLG